jgi:hypothetical protein
MTALWYWIYVVLQLTWGLMQSTFGFVIFLRHIKDPHSIFKGSILTRWKSTSGLSLGIFIFTPMEDGKITDKMIVHEYGHTLQSLVLGPLYIPFVGIPSFVWASHGRYKKMREVNGLSYSHYWTEKWADRLGEAATGMPSLRDHNKDKNKKSL